jgi:ADP-heptose:LPS heptosyltransferase
VDRYRDTCSVFDVQDDQKGLDYFIPVSQEVIPEEMHAAFKGQYMVIVVGANHFTKQIPAEKLISIANNTGIPVCLVGGKDVLKQASMIEKSLKIPFLNTVGKISLNQSASLIKQCHVVLTPDTGMMHIASAFNKNIISLWGNTVPELGMYPYGAGDKSKIFEVKNLRCRPCSKIGFAKCPKGHFNCMNNIDEKQVVSYIQSLIE